jgi:HSP20 family molecular chaperone IbpA
MNNRIKIYENARAPMTPAETMRDALRRSKTLIDPMDPFGTGDMFDIFRAIFDSPIAQTPDKSLLKWLVSSETSDVYPYDWYVDTIHNNVTEVKEGQDNFTDFVSTIKKIVHVFQIPVAGFNKNDIKVQTIPGKLRVTLGNPNNPKEDISLKQSYVVEESDLETRSRYYIKKSIKRNFVELQWNIKGLESDKVSSDIINGILYVEVSIDLNKPKTNNPWTNIEVKGTTQNS